MNPSFRGLDPVNASMSYLSPGNMKLLLIHNSITVTVNLSYLYLQKFRTNNGQATGNL